MRFSPREYQRTAMRFLFDRPKAALWAQPGMGKTSIAATTYAKLYLTGQTKRCLVVMPKRVQDVGVWTNEVRKWDHLSCLAVEDIKGPPAVRETIVKTGIGVMQTINYELLPWLIETFYDSWPWDTIIIDESTKLKKYNGVWFKGKPRKVDDRGRLVKEATPGMKHAAAKTTRVWNLTGTPAPNNVEDLWSQTFLLDGGARLGTSITRFRDKYMQQSYVPHVWAPRPGADRAVAEVLKDICLTLKAEDHLDLPPLVQNVIPVAMPAGAAREYKRLSREFFLRIREQTVEAANAAVLSGKLLQYANGFLYTNDNAEWEEVHDAKLTALEDFMEEADGPVVVCYKYLADLSSIHQRFPMAVKFDGRPDTTERFRKGRIPMLLIHPGSAGHGIDGLQDVCHTMVWYGLTWSLEEHDQVIERIGPTRQLQAGHNRPVFIHYLATQGTVDNLVLERLIEKKSVQEILLNAMRSEK